MRSLAAAGTQDVEIEAQSRRPMLQRIAERKDIIDREGGYLLAQSRL